MVTQVALGLCSPMLCKFSLNAGGATGAMGPPSAKAMSLMCVFLCVAFVMSGFKGEQRIVPMHAGCASAHRSLL